MYYCSKSVKKYGFKKDCLCTGKHKKHHKTEKYQITNRNSFMLSCIFSVKYPYYRHVSFLPLLERQTDHTAEHETYNHTGQASTKKCCCLKKKSGVGPHTEESGQDCVCCGLHLEHTAPEKALMVEAERRRSNSDCLHRLDLKKKKRQTHISRQIKR